MGRGAFYCMRSEAMASKQTRHSVSVVIGVAIGVAIGIVIDNVTMGIGIGIALGIALSLLGKDNDGK